MNIRKLFVLGVAALASCLVSKAQTNLQTFYDFGSDRQYVTMTLEGYYGDRWGDTFFFIDYDFANADLRKSQYRGSTGSYFEIARGLNFWKESALKDLSAHVELNSGVSFRNSNFLFGANYLLHNADYSNTFTFELMFKTFNGGCSSDVPLQFTFVWGMQDIFNVKGLRFSGFLDVWGENVPGGKFVMISEPQLWYNVGQFFNCPNFNLGGEVEFSYNFAGLSGFKCRPCLGGKWVF